MSMLWGSGAYVAYSNMRMGSLLWSLGYKHLQTMQYFTSK